MKEKRATVHSLYLEVSKRLGLKSLAPAPKVVWVSRPRVERTCVVCGRAVRSGQVQNEFIADDGTKAASTRSASKPGSRQRAL